MAAPPPPPPPSGPGVPPLGPQALVPLPPTQAPALLTQAAPPLPLGGLQNLGGAFSLPGLNLAGLDTNPLTSAILSQLGNNSAGPSKKRKAGGSQASSTTADSRRARSTCSETYPAGRNTIASLPDGDILSILEKLEPVQFNKYVMDTQPRSTRNACLMLAIGRGLHEKIVRTNRAAHEISCAGRYQQLGFPLRNKTPQEALEMVMKQLDPSQTGLGYSIHTTADGRQYVHNGLVSRWLDERSGVSPPPPQFHLHIAQTGQAYLSNGHQSKWAEELFKDTYLPSTQLPNESRKVLNAQVLSNLSLYLIIQPLAAAWQPAEKRWPGGFCGFCVSDSRW